MRWLVAILVLFSCACGATGRPEAAVTPMKPSPAASASPPSSPTLNITGFEAIDFIDREDGWAVVLTDAAVEISRTEDGGMTWSSPVRVTSLAEPEGDAAPRFGVRFVDRQNGWVYGAGIFSTTDSGATWTPYATRDEVFDLAVAGGTAWAVSGCDFRTTAPCSGELLQWNAASKLWSPLPHQAPLGLGPFELIRISASLAYIAQQSQFSTDLFRTANGGGAWTAVATPCNRGYAMPFATLDGVHLWMVCGSEPGAGEQGKWTYTSDDSGAHWTLRSSNDGVHASGSIPVIGYAKWMALTGPETAFMVDDRGGLYRSVDQGRTWVATGIAEGEVFFSGLQFVDPSTGWVAAETGDVALDGKIGLFRTVDGGRTWTMVSSMPGRI